MSSEDEKLQTAVHTFLPGASLLRTWTVPSTSSSKLRGVEVAMSNGERRAVMVRRPGDTLRHGPTPARREFRLLQVLYQRGLPVAKPYGLDESGTFLPGPCLLLAYLPGMPDYSPTDLGGMIPQIVSALARIHQISPLNIDLSFLPSRDGSFQDLPDLPVSNASDSELRERIQGLLRSVAPLQSRNEPVLLHGDLWPGNILWDGGRLTGIVDWEDAEVGDALVDLAIVRRDMTLIFGDAWARDVTTSYLRARLMNHAALPVWDLWTVLLALPHLGQWPAVFTRLNRHDLTEDVLRERLHRFAQEAFTELKDRGRSG